jgi:hypothetical protein
MINYSTLGNGMKRKIFIFSEKISVGFKKTTRRFVRDFVYGIIASKQCMLTEIGRALKEDIELNKTVERLGRNLSRFDKKTELTENYLKAIRPSLGDDTMLIMDGSDVTKPCSPKMEAIGSVYDASKGVFGNGYWTMGAVALTSEHDAPIPVYEKLYPCKKEGGKGAKVEAATALEFLRKHFDSKIPRIFDRGFDSGDLLKDLCERDEKFIIRVNQNRKAVHNGVSSFSKDIAAGVDCTHEMTFHSKTGDVSNCKIGFTKIVLPKLDNLHLTLIVCKEFGENTLMLYTNIVEPYENLAVRVVKAYLMRWRIEEYHSFKKQGLDFENFRVRGLNSIQNLDLLISIAVGYIGTICEKIDSELYAVDLVIASKRLQKLDVFLSETKFLFYAIHDGLVAVFDRLHSVFPPGFFAGVNKSPQIAFKGFDFLGCV